MSTEMGREQWRLVSDAAQVVANYLRCHPRVEAVRYPGLKDDPLFEKASHTLESGFGPVVKYRRAGQWERLVLDACDPKQKILELECLL